MMLSKNIDRLESENFIDKIESNKIGFSEINFSTTLFEATISSATNPIIAESNFLPTKTCLLHDFLAKPDLSKTSFTSKITILPEIQLPLVKTSKSKALLAYTWAMKYSDLLIKLDQHIITKHVKSFVKCSLCPVAFTNVHAFANHNRSVHENAAIVNMVKQCPICQVVVILNPFREHLDSHEIELKAKTLYWFNCPECKIPLKDQRYVISHLTNIHHKLSEPLTETNCSVICNGCGNEYANDFERYEHFKITHRSSGMIYAPSMYASNADLDKYCINVDVNSIAQKDSGPNQNNNDCINGLDVFSNNKINANKIIDSFSDFNRNINNNNLEKKIINLTNNNKSENNIPNKISKNINVKNNTLKMIDDIFTNKHNINNNNFNEIYTNNNISPKISAHEGISEIPDGEILINKFSRPHYKLPELSGPFNTIIKFSESDDHFKIPNPLDIIIPKMAEPSDTIVSINYDSNKYTKNLNPQDGISKLLGYTNTSSNITISKDTIVSGVSSSINISTYFSKLLTHNCNPLPPSLRTLVRPDDLPIIMKFNKQNLNYFNSNNNNNENIKVNNIKNNLNKRNTRFSNYNNKNNNIKINYNSNIINNNIKAKIIDPFNNFNNNFSNNVDKINKTNNNHDNKKYNHTEINLLRNLNEYLTCIRCSEKFTDANLLDRHVKKHIFLEKKKSKVVTDKLGEGEGDNLMDINNCVLDVVNAKDDSDNKNEKSVNSNKLVLNIDEQDADIEEHKKSINRHNKKNELKNNECNAMVEDMKTEITEAYSTSESFLVINKKIEVENTIHNKPSTKTLISMQQPFLMKAPLLQVQTSKIQQNWHPCGLCKKVFYSSETLAIHRKGIHDGKGIQLQPVKQQQKIYCLLCVKPLNIYCNSNWVNDDNSNSNIDENEFINKNNKFHTKNTNGMNNNNDNKTNYNEIKNLKINPSVDKSFSSLKVLAKHLRISHKLSCKTKKDPGVFALFLDLRDFRDSSKLYNNNNKSTNEFNIVPNNIFNNNVSNFKDYNNDEEFVKVENFNYDLDNNYNNSSSNIKNKDIIKSECLPYIREATSNVKKIPNMINIDEDDNDIVEEGEVIMRLRNFRDSNSAFVCYTCASSFTNREDLGKHLQSIHNTMMSQSSDSRKVIQTVDREKTFQNEGEEITKNVSLDEFLKFPCESFQETLVSDKTRIPCNNSSVITQSITENKIKNLRIVNPFHLNLQLSNMQNFNKNNDDKCIQCTECGACFVVMASLKRHLLAVHKVYDFSAYEHETGFSFETVTESSDFFTSLETIWSKIEKQEEKEKEFSYCGESYKISLNVNQKFSGKNKLSELCQLNSNFEANEFQNTTTINLQPNVTKFKISKPFKKSKRGLCFNKSSLLSKHLKMKNDKSGSGRLNEKTNENQRFFDGLKSSLNLNKDINSKIKNTKHKIANLRLNKKTNSITAYRKNLRSHFEKNSSSITNINNLNKNLSINNNEKHTNSDNNEDESISKNAQIYTSLIPSHSHKNNDRDYNKSRNYLKYDTCGNPKKNESFNNNNNESSNNNINLNITNPNQIKIDININKNTKKSDFKINFSTEPGIEPISFRQSTPNKKTTSKSPSTIECQVCYKIFQEEINLKKHMRAHGMAFIMGTTNRRASRQINT